MNNSYSVSALIGVFWGLVRIRLRLAALWLLRLIPASKIKLRRSLSQPVAVIL
jgi:hypothetical protein